MQLGTILLWGDDLDRFRRLVRRAETLGFERIGVGDSPAAWHDLYVSLAIAATETESAILTPMVTTPHLRHPAVTANAMSSIGALTGGRVELTIGSGGSALRSIGRLAAARQHEMREYVTALRHLLDGGTATVDGLTTAPMTRAHPMPIFISADGPKGLRLAGEIADGVVMSCGLSLERVDQKLAIVREAAAAVGRDPSTIEVRALSFTAIADSRDAANAQITAFLASTAGMGLKAPHMRALIPDDLLPAVEEIERRYDPTQHTVAGGTNARLVEELGLIDFVVDLNSITGTEEQVADHLDALHRRGITCVFAPLPGIADPESLLESFASAAARIGV